MKMSVQVFFARKKNAQHFFTPYIHLDQQTFILWRNQYFFCTLNIQLLNPRRKRENSFIPWRKTSAKLKLCPMAYPKKTVYVRREEFYGAISSVQPKSPYFLFDIIGRLI